MLLSYRRILKAFVVVIFAVLLCGCTMGLRCIVVMFCRLGVRLLHCYFFPFYRRIPFRQEAPQ
jgi:hypothetical protein